MSRYQVRARHPQLAAEVGQGHVAHAELAERADGRAGDLRALLLPLGGHAVSARPETRTGAAVISTREYELRGSNPSKGLRHRTLSVPPVTGVPESSDEEDTQPQPRARLGHDFRVLNYV
jgi:hypothetical protein